MLITLTQLQTSFPGYFDNITQQLHDVWAPLADNEIQQSGMAWGTLEYQASLNLTAHMISCAIPNGFAAANFESLQTSEDSYRATFATSLESIDATKFGREYQRIRAIVLGRNKGTAAQSYVADRTLPEGINFGS